MTDSNTDTDSEEHRIQVGRRVVCRRPGPHDGKRGRVSDRIGEAVVVTFSDTQTVDKPTYFEPVDHE